MGIEREAAGELGRRIAELSPAKRALLEMRLNRRGAPSARERPLSPRDRSGPLPLSFGQQRLWLLEQLAPGTALYHIPKAMRVTGRLDTGALQAALDAIVARHEALRTHFVSAGESPTQVVAAPRPVELRAFDLRDVPGPLREGRARELLEREVGRPFDLGSGLMLRAALLRLDDEEYLLLLVTHHIASDGWSMGILSRELAVLYEASAAGQTPALPELPIQYADYALWQREWLQGDALAEQAAYWRQKLDGIPEVLDLPSDRPRPPVASYQGGSESVLLPPSLTEALRALARGEGATLFMLLLAAWKTLLSRYSGQTDLVVGSPIAGRGQVETEGLIGFFVNTLALRTDLSGDLGFRELLARVRETALDAYAHQDLPFEKLVEDLQPERTLSRNPLFQVMFALQNASMPPVQLSGMSLTPVVVERTTAKFDLTLEVFEREGGLRCWLEYSSDLFDGATAARMLGHFRVLLEGIVADPDGRIAALPILTEVERRQILVEWNGTDAGYPRDRCVHQLFEEQAALRPDAPAVVFGESVWTYAELDRRANRIAHSLREQGVGPDTPVAVYAERSPATIAALLGILKAGGAYLPLDPEYPEARLAFMLADSGATVLLAPEGRREEPASLGVRVLPIEPDGAAVGEDPPRRESPVGPDHLAYLIYTSGSTGRPKGVMVEHRGWCSLAHDLARRFEVVPGSRVLQITSPSFDVSLGEIGMALASGATLVQGTRDELLPGPELLRLLAEQRVNVVFTVPSVFAALPDADLPDLCTLGLGGEPCPAELVTRWGAGRRLLNAYGPTETTIISTLAECTPDGRKPSIGRPVANTQVYILDRNGQPVPIGVPGEIYIGGAGLARGYLNRPELTAERFVRVQGSGFRVQDPDGAERSGARPLEGGCLGRGRTADGSPLTEPRTLNPEPSIRLYKTGDLARYLPDGSIEFLGRADHQVKLRGFRIELGEIEATLGQHPRVRDAVVLLREDVPGDQRLAAYVVTRDGGRGTGSGSGSGDGGTGRQGDGENLDAQHATCSTTPPPHHLTTGTLRAFLKERLPEYMVPSAFVILDALPLTPNGKVDRRALPRPEPGAPDQTVVFAAPRTATEETLAEAWRAILAREPIGVDDDFFALGGHSLLATRVISRVRDLFGVEIPLRRLFEAPTIAAFAEAIDRARSAGEAPRAPAIVPLARRRRAVGGEPED